MPQKKQRAANGSGRKTTKTANGQSDDLIRIEERLATFDERRAVGEFAGDSAGHSTSDEAVRTRAYYLFLERGRRSGHELDDWLRAEDEVRL